ncbi:MAG: cell division protein FtsA [Acidobacteriaceae bacterium]
MNPRQENLITVLDAGSSKICVLVAELQDGVLRYRGHGIEPARGMRKGLIAELDPAAEAINKAALTAERVARTTIETAVVGIGGTHVRGVNSRGGISLGSRMRAPEGTAVGSVRRVNISNVVVYDADPRYGSIISGIPGHDVEDVKLSDIRILYRGGLTLDQVAKQPADLVNTFFFRGSGGVPPREPYSTPEREKEYPEPSMFGMLPAYGFFIRHATGIELNNVEVGYMKEDRRPAFVLDTVKGIDMAHVKMQKASGVPAIVLRNAEDFSVYRSFPVPDAHVDKADRKDM